MIPIIYIIFFKMGSGGRSQVSSCGKTHYSDTLRIYSKFLRSGTNYQYRTLGILEGTPRTVAGFMKVSF